MAPPCAIRIYVCGTRRAGARPETAAQRALLLQHTLPLPPSRSCPARVAVVLAAEVQVNSILGLSPPKEKKGGVLVVILVTGLLLTDPDYFSRTKAH